MEEPISDQQHEKNVRELTARRDLLKTDGWKWLLADAQALRMERADGLGRPGLDALGRAEYVYAYNDAKDFGLRFHERVKFLEDEVKRYGRENQE